jgi:PTH1 family peptidyl-tRNA hydrolase
MFLFVGLGNIGKEYENTRHNVGFIIADKFIKEYNFSQQSDKFHSEVWSGTINCEKCFIIKPQTFMNKSGIAVSEIKNFYKIPLENIYVFHDDLDVALGKVKYKVGGGSGGHNGIKSIDEMIGKEYNRVRIGIGRPVYKDDIVNFVLNKFSEDERISIENICDRIVNNINLLLNNKDLFLTKIVTL